MTDLALRVFSGGDAPPIPPVPGRRRNQSLSPEMRLSEFVALYFRPIYLEQVSDSDFKTIELYDQSVRLWQSLVDDPPLYWIDEIVLARFVGELRKQPGRQRGSFLSAYTVRKHCRNIQAILYRCGPRSQKMRHGQGLLEEVPVIEMPKVPIKPPAGDFTVDEIGRWLSSVLRTAARPDLTGVRAGDWWFALILTAYCTGIRLEQLMLLDYSMLHVDGADAELIMPEGICKRGVGQRLFLHPAARAAIDKIRTGCRPEIFYWPNIRSAAKNTRRNAFRWLQTNRKQLLRTAGIPEARQFGFHGLRKCAATEMADYNPMAAQIFLNHAGGSTMGRHYVSHRLLKDAILALPLPPVDLEDSRQKRLF